jgi:hypothetical protein
MAKESAPGALHLLVPHICIGEQDAELHRQLVEKPVDEEGIVLLAPGAEGQHLDKKLLMASGWPAVAAGEAVPPAEYPSADAQPKGGNGAACTGSKGAGQPPPSRQ